MVVKRRNDGGKRFRRWENGTADEVKWFGNKAVKRERDKLLGLLEMVTSVAVNEIV